jgi:hypothetical protein
MATEDFSSNLVKQFSPHGKLPNHPKKLLGDMNIFSIQLALGHKRLLKEPKSFIK